MKEYKVIIQTNKYAGNFEREMCAFITGHIGECEVGKKFMNNITESEQKILGDIMHKGEGCLRPVDISNLNNEAIEIYFYNKPSKESIEYMERAAKIYAEKVQTEEGVLSIVTECSCPEFEIHKDLKILGVKAIEVSTITNETEISYE